MENAELSVGDTVANSDLPPVFQAQPETMQEAADNHGVSTTDITALSVVPSDSDVAGLEDQLQQGISALETIQVVRKALESVETLSAPAARAATAALERHGIVLRLPSREALATGDASLTFYAKEALATQERSLMARVIDLFMKWAKDTFLWVQSLVSRRGRAKEAVALAAKELPRLNRIKLSPSGFSGAHWCLGAGHAPANDASIEAAARASVHLLGDLTWKMRDLLSHTGKLFRETPNDAAGVLRNLEAVKILGAYIGTESVFNPKALGGFSWTIASSESYRSAHVGQPLPMFTLEYSTDVYDQMDKEIEGTMSALAFSAIVKAASTGLSQSELVIKALESYAKNLNGLRPTKTAETSRGTITSADIESMKSLVSTSSMLRLSASYYDRVVCTVALDCARALKYAERKA